MCLLFRALKFKVAKRTALKKIVNSVTFGFGNLFFLHSFFICHALNSPLHPVLKTPNSWLAKP